MAVPFVSPIRTTDDWRREWIASRDDPDGYWLGVTRRCVAWDRPPTIGLDGGYRRIQDGPFAWFGDGELNVTVSCLDRHLTEHADRIALIWEGDEPGDVRHLTTRALYEDVCRTANALRELGVRKGDRVIVYMGMVPEAAVAMLACARIGAVHSVVFGGFSAEALRDRILDCGAEVVITQDEGRRGGRAIPLKEVADRAIGQTDLVRRVLVFRRTGADVGWTDDRDVAWQDLVPRMAPDCPPVPCAAEDPLFVLYTSGSTGKPKGLVHTCGGYLTWATWTCAVTFGLRPDDRFACMADIGWITGHTYVVYGPLSNGVPTLMFESVPTHPDPGRYWDVVERHRITALYTAPTAIRTLAAQDTAFVTRHDRSSLRVLGTVGEPIDPEAWRWFHDVVGEGRCAVVDTWWQTETGGHMIAPVAHATPTPAGSATRPLPGVFPELLDEEGRLLRGPAVGRLFLSHPWPGQARTVWGDHDRYVATYFSTHPGLYFTGDGARRDAEGNYWITGRVDDVLNVSGHRIGTAELEAALVALHDVAEAAVVGFPHPLKGQGVHAYVVLQPGDRPNDSLEEALQQACRQAIGAHARVDRFQVVPGLPKTRSGKVMRRILRKIAEGRAAELGDVSTLADAAVVEAIVAGAYPSR